MSRLRRSLGYLPTALLVGAVIFSFGFYAGKYGLPPREPLPRGEGRAVDMTNFWAAKKFIEDEYPGKVESQELISGASQGLVQGLGDPYSAYLTPDLAEQLEQVLAGKVEGIGVEIGLKEGQPTVIAPLPGSPAAAAGVAAGDIFVSVDGQSVQGFSIDEVAKRVRGKQGTEVTIEFARPGVTAPRSLKITRAEVKAPSVTLEYRDDVAVIELARFGPDTKGEFEKAISDIQVKRPKGVILDLRSNPGGFLDGAVYVSGVFMKSGVVVKEQFAKGRTETKTVDSDGRLSDMPLVILVDQGSASAAEITAGALRDNRGVKLVGERTFGKGSVQELKNLEGGAVLKLTVAEWLTPKGTTISKEGLLPDVEVSSDDPEAQLSAAIKQLP